MNKNDIKHIPNCYVEMEQIEEDLLLLIFKYGFQKVEKVLESMKPTIRDKLEERLKIILHVEENIIKEEVSEPIQVSEPVLEPDLVQQEKLPKGTNEKKKLQREAEKKKREENEAQGIFAQDLLTEENLRAWRSTKYSNAYIAREFVGCREEEVAKALKKFNIVA